MGQLMRGGHTTNDRLNIRRKSGFTIVELLIVIVVIGILAAITIVAYNGIQQRARDADMTATLQSASKKAQVEYSLKGAFPSAAELGGGSKINLTLSDNPTPESLCITGTGTGYPTKSVDQSGSTSDGPCDGHSGGPSYCPNNSVIDINGYYCEGTTGSIAAKQTHAIKLDASTSPVPSGAPGSYVGRQGSRDNLSSARISAVAGDVFCVSGWVSTIDSTVQHRLGIMYQGSYGNSWLGHGVSADSARNKWVKISGCTTAPANTTSAGLWTQNDGTNGTTANPFWYQTAITLTKQ